MFEYNLESCLTQSRGLQFPPLVLQLMDTPPRVSSLLRTAPVGAPAKVRLTLPSPTRDNDYRCEPYQYVLLLLSLSFVGRQALGHFSRHFPLFPYGVLEF